LKLVLRTVKKIGSKGKRNAPGLSFSSSLERPDRAKNSIGEGALNKGEKTEERERRAVPKKEQAD